MRMTDVEFEELFAAAVVRAAELDYAEMPSDDDIDKIVQPSARAQHKMKNLIHNPNGYIRRLRRPIYMKVLRIAASFIVTLTLLLGATMAISPTVRAAVIDFVRSWFEDRTVYEASSGNIDREWIFTYIPDGFNLIDEVETEFHLLYVYQDNHGTILTISVSGERQVIDNEHAEFSEAIIGGRIADIYESVDPHYPSTIIVFDYLTGLFITFASEIEIAELMMIVEGIE